MRKRIFACLTTLVLLCSTGCGAKDSDVLESVSPQDSVQTDAPTDELSESSGEEAAQQNYDWRITCAAFQTAEEAAACEGVSRYPFFILHDGWFYHLDLKRMTYQTSSNVTEFPVVDAMSTAAEDLPVLNLSEGDQLVTFSADESSYGLIPITDKGACLPVTWMGGMPRTQLSKVSCFNPDFTILPNLNGVKPEGVVAEIQGQTITPFTGALTDTQGEDKMREANDAFRAVLDSLGITYLTVDGSWNNGSGLESGTRYYSSQIILGEYGDKLTLGQYQGTQYVESECILDATLYSLDVASLLTTASEPTHDGYFVVQIPDEISGLYAVQRDNTSLVIGGAQSECYAFSIVR